MFDLDISKMAVIGTVALVVLGPERLPRVARTAGTLLGRAQRYINNVQAEVDQQIRMDDLRKFKNGIEQAAADIQRTVDQNVRQHAGELKAGVDAVTASVAEGLPTTYLPSIHESAGDLQAEMFKVRAAPASLQASAAVHSSQRDVVAGGAPGTSSQARVKANWRGTGSAGRRGAVKRSRIVSTAASKALGRNQGRLA